jgi:hypothetical protein
VHKLTLGGFHVPDYWFPIFRNCGFTGQEYSNDKTKAILFFIGGFLGAYLYGHSLSVYFYGYLHNFSVLSIVFDLKGRRGGECQQGAINAKKEMERVHQTLLHFLFFIIVFQSCSSCFFSSF